MTPPPHPSIPDQKGNNASETRHKRILLYGGGAFIATALALFAGWYFVLRDTSPASVTSAEQAEARDSAIAEATERDTESVPSADATAEPTEPASSAGIDGTWTVDTDIGSFADFSSTFAGFRIDEEVASIGAKTVVGRTPDVSGTLEAEGTTVTATEIAVDLTTLTTGSSPRDGQLRRQALETSTFPEGTFVLTQPTELGELPADGGTVEATATGDLTIHGVTQNIDIPLTAEFNSGVVVVVGQLNLLLEDFDIAKPQAAMVLSVEDNADLELQLFFTR